MNAKRLVFTITSGRSGTQYLTHLLSDIAGIRAEHEPMPGFHGLAMPARHDPALAAQFLKKIKLPHIAGLSEPVYVETSHYFAKGFVEPLLALPVVPDLILLPRDPRKVAASWFLVGGTLETCRKGQFYKNMLGPNEPNFLPVREWQTWNDYQFCYWYALETHARIRHYKGLIAMHGGKNFTTNLDALTLGDDYARLLTWLDVAPDIIARRVRDSAWRGQVVNDMADKKRTRGRESELAAMDVDVLEAQVRFDCGVTPARLTEIISP